MGTKLSEKENELYQRIDEITHYIWDPIGIAGNPGARNEYYSYLPEIYKLAKLSDTKDKIAEYLNNIQTERMGMDSDIDRWNEIASLIMDWSKSLGFFK